MKTSNLDLDLLAAGQAQKHVTHNEALLKLDRTCQLAVNSRNETSPPANPAEGDTFWIAADHAAAWGVVADRLAHYVESEWVAEAPLLGMMIWVVDEGKAMAWSGSDWVEIGPIGDLATLGVNTSGDSTNRLAVKSDAVLFSHDDVTPGNGDVQVKLNKATTGSTGSFLFQTNWSGRAEFGLTGSDSFALKVSPDGATFDEALTVNPNDAGVWCERWLGAPALRLAGWAVGDDQMVEVDLPQGARDQGMLMLSSDHAGLAAILAYDLSGTPSLTLISTSYTGNLTLALMTLTGTTGSDGDLTLSAQPGKVQLENRTGSSLELRLLFIG